MHRAAVLVGAWLLPSIALACGGLFCNAATPVTQAAERIMFAPGEREGTLQMHVRITWAGPPEEFGWLLPVPADVETGVSTEALFAALDRIYTPQFRVRDECIRDPDEYGDGGEGGAGGAGGMGGGGGDGPDVAVLGRSAVGPYDQALLRAEQAEDLIEWLDENGFNAPDGAEAVLQHYLDAGSAMLALKLLPDEGVNDISPIWLEFEGDQPVVPIRPTALAAQPDMGVIVHILGETRAVPINYLHVEFNLAAIDWRSRGSNYADVVGQAVDEAGGMAFVTDFSGPIDPPAWQRFRELAQIGEETFERLRAAERVEDVFNAIREADGTITPAMRALLMSHLVPPDGVTIEEVVDRWWRYDDLPMDGAAVAADIALEINPPRLRVERAVTGSPWLTRLFTTLSPDEMQIDPIFDFNPDLEPVGNEYIARRHGPCAEPLLTLPDGRTYFEEGRNGLIPIWRRGGVTLRGRELPAAITVVRHFSAGQPEVIRVVDLENTGTGAGGGGGSAGEPQAAPTVDAATNSDGGCDGCATRGAPGSPIWLLGLGLLVMRRRR